MPKKNSDGYIFNQFFHCPCGREHRIFISRGEAQLIWRATCNGKLPPDFRVRHVILKATGRMLGNGQPEYVVDQMPEEKEAS